MAVAQIILGSQAEIIALVQLDFAFGKHAQAHFRAFGICNRSNYLTGLFCCPAHQLQPFAMILMIAVRKVEACQIHACKHHLTQQLYIVRAGTYCTDNLRFLHQDCASSVLKLILTQNLIGILCLRNRQADFISLIMLASGTFQLYQKPFSVSICFIFGLVPQCGQYKLFSTY